MSSQGALCAMGLDRECRRLKMERSSETSLKMNVKVWEQTRVSELVGREHCQREPGKSVEYLWQAGREDGRLGQASAGSAAAMEEEQC